MNLFLFAHQDDEYFVAPFLEREPARARCVFLTMGDFHGTSCAVRNAESLRALRSLGVPEEHILFAGEKLRVPDNDLVSHLPAALALLLAECGGAQTVIAPAYEGGHPDHDAACLLGHAFAARAGGPPVLEFAAYRAHSWLPHYYTVMQLPEDRKREEASLPMARFSPRNFFLFRFYPSQWRTWLGLLPPLLSRYLTNGNAGIYPARQRDFRIRPHEGKLYYEYRRWSTFERFGARTEQFRRINLTAA